MEEKISGGYECITTAQIANLVVAGTGSPMPTSALRCYLALLVITASRGASARTAKAKGVEPKAESSYSIQELLDLMPDLTERTIRSALRALKKAALATVKKKEITLNAFPNEEAKAWMEKAGVKQRVIPAPRRMLRFLARSNKRSLIITTLAYMTRGLFKYRKEIKGVGTAKISWIATNFKLSATSVKASRRELIEIGFISKDEKSHQLKLNRTGAYFQVSLNWDCEQLEPQNGVGETCENAPLPAKNYTQSAPPYRKQLTPYGSTKTNKPLKRASGFCKAKVNFRSIKPEDIKKIPLLLLLFQSAVEQGFLANTERNLLNFFATAVKAKRSWKNPTRIFVWTVQNDFKFINDSDEKQAEKTLKNYQSRNPEAFSFLHSQPSESQIQPKDELKKQQDQFQQILENLVNEKREVA